MSDDMMERELKLQPQDAALLDRLSAVETLGSFKVAARGHEEQHNFFFDTSSRSLRAGRISFRRREVEGQSLATWSIKGPGAHSGGVMSRPEVEVRLASDSPPMMALEVLQQTAREHGAPLLAEAVADALAGGELPQATPVLTFDNDRRLVHLTDEAHGWRVELALDEVRLPGHDHFVDLEIEGELKQGDEAALEVIESAIRALGEVTHSVGAKSQRVSAHLAECPVVPTRGNS